MSDAIVQWNDFNVAMVGANAALAGLVIVAASVNIRKIVESTTLTARLAAAISALVLALVVSAVGLIPDVELAWYGPVVLIAAVGAGVFQVHATMVIMHDPDPTQHLRVAKSVLGFIPILAYLGAGIAMLAAHPAGLILAAAGGIVAIVSAILVSWIALVEVLR